MEQKLLDRKDSAKLILQTDSNYIPKMDDDFKSSSKTIDEEVDYDADHDGTPSIIKDKLNFGSEGDSILYKVYVSADFIHRNFSLANAFSFDIEMSMGEMYDEDDENIFFEYDPLRLFDDDEDDWFSSRYNSLTLELDEIESITNLLEGDDLDLFGTGDNEFDEEDYVANEDHEPEEKHQK